MTKTSNFTLAAGLVAAALPGIAAAQASPHSFSGKVAVYSEYEYRGLAQTSEDPALQVTLDYGHASGFYVGTFVSNVSWIEDTAKQLGVSSDAKIEWDIYGGYKWSFAPGWTLDVGYLRYEYPSAGRLTSQALDPSTDEIYAGVSWGPATLKYSHAISELFGVPDSKGSGYLELAVNQPLLEGLTLNLLVGHQRYKGSQGTTLGTFANSNFDYTVYKAGLTWEVARGLAVGAYYKGTDADPQYFTILGKDYSDDRAVAFVSYSF